MALTLLQHGWTNVRPLLGGLDAWVKAGYPTEAKPATKMNPREVAANLQAAEGDDK